jgi:4-hydroxybenzoate polyprenyltransferase/phosphoglycolate phosphatase-like HAD superfamily hydrolase
MATREVLVVDMDRTLLATDMTMEAVLAFLGKHPLKLFTLIGWALQGRSVLKARLAEAVMPGVALAPVNPEVLALVEERRAAGAHTVLASASNERVVAAVAERFGVFDTVMGATEANNFKGSAKADALDAAYGAGGYTYVGDSPSDLKVWSRAGGVVTAGAPKGLRGRAEALGKPVRHLALASREPGAQARAFIKAMRPHQWSKNILIFVPLLAAQAFSVPVLLNALIAFVVFSMTASSVYVLNDLLDLDADRAHPRKRKRPFASGLVAIKDGLWLAPLLLLGAIALAIAFLPVPFLAVLGLYYIATLTYSFWLKQKIMVDVFLLAGLYTARIVAGGAATLIPMSPWLIGFSIFFFLALAIVKRLAELIDMVRANKPRSSKRDYSAQDLGMVQSLGAAAGFAAILVLNFYFTSPEATRFYAAPEYLWAVSPLLLFWMSRMLVLANRGEVDDDPIVFAAKDRTSRLVGVCVVAIVLCAEFLPWPL